MKFKTLLKLKRMWQAYVLSSVRIPYSQWKKSTFVSPSILCLSTSERTRLRKITSLFLRKKTISFIGDMNDEISKQIHIAAQASLLILNLDLDCFEGWSEVIVYPESFVVNREEFDRNGVAHKVRRVLAGESWRRGPVVLSWSDADPHANNRRLGSNVILHEFAHKLDTLNGPADGYPPLHSGMQIEEWTSALKDAFDTINHKLDYHHRTFIDPYAAESPAEFFAVLTEVFFEQPIQLKQLYPEVYKQYSLYYRQDPASRAG